QPWIPLRLRRRLLLPLLPQPGSHARPVLPVPKQLWLPPEEPCLQELELSWQRLPLTSASAAQQKTPPRGPEEPRLAAAAAAVVVDVPGQCRFLQSLVSSLQERSRISTCESEAIEE